MRGSVGGKLTGAPAGEDRIERTGDVLTVYPAALTIPEMAARLRALPVPPAVEQRDTDEIPERPGL